MNLESYLFAVGGWFCLFIGLGFAGMNPHGAFWISLSATAYVLSICNLRHPPGY